MIPPVNNFIIKRDGDPIPNPKCNNKPYALNNKLWLADHDKLFRNLDSNVTVEEHRH